METLDRLLRPKSVAVIGGGVWCENVISQLRKTGFAGEIWSIHPKRKTFVGLVTYKSVADLPSPPDACFVGVNRFATIKAIKGLAQMGAGGAVCFASGFSEADEELGDGADMQEELRAAAGNMPILGPNCYGIVNYLDNVALWPDQHGGQKVSSGVAIVMQSSNIAINVTMQARGLPIAFMATVGNQAQIGMSQVGAALLEDPRITALGLHIEGIDDLRAFEALSKRSQELGKPIVALKVGASDQAQAATVSHTASLAGSDAGARALLERLGIGQAKSLSGFLDTLKLLHVVGPLSSNQITAASCSGGEASLVADSVMGRNLEFPSLSDKQYKALRSALGLKVSLSNPLDYHTYIWGDQLALNAAFSALVSGDVSLGCVVLDFPRADRCDPSAWRPVIPAVVACAQSTGKPMAIISSLPETMPESLATELVDLGIVPLSGISDAVEAISIAAQIGPGVQDQSPVLTPRKGAKGSLLSEADAKQALAEHGLVIPHAQQAATPIGAGAVAEEIGFPVVLKGEGIAHKTEAGAVILGLKTSRDVTAAAQKMASNHFLVEEMVSDGVAELLIGVVRDDAHGYVLTLAAGGQFTELLQDRASLLVPAHRDAVRKALMTLKIAPILLGYRGKPGINLEAAIDAVMAVQDYVAVHHPSEVEVNPLICGPHGAVAADALIKVEKAAQ